MRTVLVVDDEENIRSSLSLLLKANFEVQTASDGEEALQKIAQEAPDIVLLDIMMPKLDGIETLRRLRKSNQSLPVIMLTAANTARDAVQALKLGAIDYLNKPFDVEQLTSLMIDTLEQGQQAPVEIEVSLPETSSRRTPAEMVAHDSSMVHLMETVDQVAKTDATVLITGESGVGKELIARAIHEASLRANVPFVPIYCAAFPETLIESELFGHEKGAFTSAIDLRRGHFELANGGTLFLDEIGELSLAVQVKMLRFLQEQEFFRVGSSTPLRVNVRVIAATNQKLEELVESGQFRRDLYYRINVVHLAVPSLRERYEDIPALLEHFVGRFQSQYGEKLLKFDESALRCLREYSWPGNVRELENLVESLLALCSDETISHEHLPLHIREPKRREPIQFQVFDGGLNFEEAEKQFESDMILKALRKTDFVQTRAAELLGISRRILKYKMDKLGITDSLENNTAEESLESGEGNEE